MLLLLVFTKIQKGKTQMINIPENVQLALKMLNSHGFEAYIVGGCVRDFLLSKTPNDYDITTNALPEETQEVFKDFKCIDIGKKHGTIAVLINKMLIEITTYRIDGAYTDKRHPESVSFSKNLQDDLSRRDFTVNALAYNNLNETADFFNGKEDLKNKIIRCVGDPMKRFDEDALRIMRAVRFASQLDFTIEPETEKCIFSLKDTLSMIAVERIRTELDKLLCGKAVFDILMKYHDVIAVFIPEIAETVGFEQHSVYHRYTVWEHTARAVKNAPCDSIIRLTMLLHDIAKPCCFKLDEKGRGHFIGHPQKSSQMAFEILRRMKYDNKTINDVTQLIKYHDTKFTTRQDIKKTMSITGTELFEKLIEVQIADSLSKDGENQKPLNDMNFVRETYLDILAKNECTSLKALRINGSDLQKHEIHGKNIGYVLNILLNEVIMDKTENKHDILEKRCEEIKKSHHL